MNALVASDGTRLAVRDYGGPADARGVVLVHGLASNLAIWDRTGPALAKRFRVLAYDQRSHGRSQDATEYSYELLAADCARVADLVRDPVLVGHSWGASVVLHCAAAQSSVRGVVCVDGGVFDWQSMGRSWEETEALLTPPHIEGPAAAVLQRLRDQSALPWEAAEPVVRRSFVIGEDGVMRRRTPVPEHMKIVRTMWEDRLLDVHARIRCPVLLVLARGTGEETARRFTAAKDDAAARVLRANPQVRLEWIDSVHDVPLAKPDELTRLIARFAAAT